MNCEQIGELLSPYIDQMTDTKENDAIIAHLSACADCREQLKQLESLSAMMHDLYAPQLPDYFAQELRQHLNDEKITILKPKDLKRPSKAGWIAAALALVALGTGIFASSFVPSDNIIALREQQVDKPSQKTTLSVEDILTRLNIWDNKDTGVTTDIADNSTAAEKTGPETVAPVKDNNNVQVLPVVEVEPEPGIKIADIYSARIKVDSTKESIDRVIQIAQANQAEYDLVGTGNLVQAFSAGKSEMIELKVAHAQVDSLIKELEPIGMVAAPMHDEAVLTEEYAKTLQQINSINDKIAEAKVNDDQEQLKQLNRDLYDWTSRKEIIDKENDLATVRVYLIEEIKP